MSQQARVDLTGIGFKRQPDGSYVNTEPVYATLHTEALEVIAVNEHEDQALEVIAVNEHEDQALEVLHDAAFKYMVEADHHRLVELAWRIVALEVERVDGRTLSDEERRLVRQAASVALEVAHRSH